MNSDFRIIQGTAAHIDLPDESVHCVITSPPYYGLRAYGSEPAIWDELPDAPANQPPCTHTWKSAGEIVNRGGNPNTLSEKQLSNAGSVDSSRCQAGYFCTACGAWKGELGSEPTLELYVRHMVQIFREVRRVLRKDGTAWINLGDSYAGSGKGSGGSFQGNNVGSLTAPPITSKRFRPGAGRADGKVDERGQRNRNGLMAVEGYKSKDMMNVPFLVFEALRQDGWYFRRAIPWVKANGMPESAPDRPTVSVEWFGFFSKSQNCYYDQESVKLPAKYSSAERKARVKAGQKSNPTGQVNGTRAPSEDAPPPSEEDDASRFRRVSDFFFDSLDEAIEQETNYLNHLRQARREGMLQDREGEPLAVIMATGQSDEDHFATYSTKLISPMIRASTSDKGVCPKCGAPWKRIIEKEKYKVSDSKVWSGADKRNNAEDPRTATVVATLGWVATCKHGNLEPVAAVVFDSFSGTGTTGAAALQLGRAYVGQEIMDEHIAASVKRLNRIARTGTVETKKGERQMTLPFGEAAPKKKHKKATHEPKVIVDEAAKIFEPHPAQQAAWDSVPNAPAPRIAMALSEGDTPVKGNPDEIIVMRDDKAVWEAPPTLPTAKKILPKPSPKHLLDVVDGEWTWVLPVHVEDRDISTL